MALDIVFTGRNPFTNEQIAAGISAAHDVFAKHGLDAEAAWSRNVASIEEHAQEDEIWSEADHAAAVAMCGGKDTTAAENAMLEWY